MALEREKQEINPRFGGIARLSNPSVGVSWSGGGAASSFGRQLQTLGNTLMGIGEERMAAENAQAAQDRAWSVPLLRGPDGKLLRPATPPGGWQNQAIYDKIVDNRFTDQLMFDITSSLDKIAIDNWEDPAAAEQKMTSAVAGFMQGIDPKYSNQILPQIQQQQASRVRAIAYRKAAADARLAKAGRIESMERKTDAMFDAMVFGDEGEITATVAVAQAQFNESLAAGDISIPPGSTPEDEFNRLQLNLRVQSQIYRDINKELEKGSADPKELAKLVEALDKTQIALAGFDNGPGIGNWDADKLRRAIPDPADRKSLATRLGALASEFAGKATQTQSERNIAFILDAWDKGARGMIPGLTLTNENHQDAAYVWMRNHDFGFDARGMQAVFAATGVIPKHVYDTALNEPMRKSQEDLDNAYQLFNALGDIMNPDGTPANLQLSVSDDDRRFFTSYGLLLDAGMEGDQARQKTLDYIDNLQKTGFSDREIIHTAIQHEAESYTLSPTIDRVGQRILDIVMEHPGWDDMRPQVRMRMQAEAQRLLAIELSMSAGTTIDDAVANTQTRLMEMYVPAPFIEGGWSSRSEMVPTLPDLETGEQTDAWAKHYTDIIIDMVPEENVPPEFADARLGKELKLVPVGGGRTGQFYLTYDPGNQPNTIKPRLRGDDGALIVVDLQKAAGKQYEQANKALVELERLRAVQDEWFWNEFSEYPERLDPLATIQRWSRGEFGPDPLMKSLNLDAHGRPVNKPAGIVMEDFAGDELVFNPADGPEVIRHKAAQLAAEYQQRGLPMPPDIRRLIEDPGTIEALIKERTGLLPALREDIDPRYPADADTRTRGLPPLPGSDKVPAEPISQSQFMEDPAGAADIITKYITEDAPEQPLEEFMEQHLIFASAPVGGQPFAGGAVGIGELGNEIVQQSTARGVNPEFVATLMSYETGGTMDIWARGPVTHRGQHRGLIQMGNAERAKYGYYKGMSAKAAVKASLDYLFDRGAKPGDDLATLYRIVIGGNRNADLNKSDGYGTIRQHIGRLQDHVPNARKLVKLGGDPSVAAGPLQLKFKGKPVQMQDLSNIDRGVLNVAATAYMAIGEGELDIQSGFRSHAHNAAVGGAKNSQHLKGYALDLNTTGWSNERKLRLIKALSDAGAGGIGVYANNIHVDIGRKRAWGPNYHYETVPAWAREAIDTHLGTGARTVVAASTAYKNRNPVGLRDGPAVVNVQAVGTSGGRLVFPTEVQGINAAAQTFQNLMYSSQNTPQLIIDALYHDEDPYVRSRLTTLIARTTNVEEDERLDLTDTRTMTRLALALSAYENGGAVYKSGYIRAGMEANNGRRA